VLSRPLCLVLALRRSRITFVTSSRGTFGRASRHLVGRDSRRAAILICGSYLRIPRSNGLATDSTLSRGFRVAHRLLSSPGGYFCWRISAVVRRLRAPLIVSLACSDRPADGRHLQFAARSSGELMTRSMFFDRIYLVNFGVTENHPLDQWQSIP
jgi:hypothetical protein